MPTFSNAAPRFRTLRQPRTPAQVPTPQQLPTLRAPVDGAGDANPGNSGSTVPTSPGGGAPPAPPAPPVNQPLPPTPPPPNSPPPLTPPRPPTNPPTPPTDMRPVPQPPIVETVDTMGTPVDPGSPEYEDNLRARAFLPGGDERLAGAQTRTDAAGNAVMSGRAFGAAAQAGEGRYRSLFGTAEEGDRVSRYGDAQDAALEGLGGPNRTELAKQALRDFDESSAEGNQQRFRQIMQYAARGGRIGMGETGRSMIDAGRLMEQDRSRFQNQLAREVSEGDINDRFRRVDAVSGLRGQEAGIERGLRDENLARARSTVDYAGRDADREIADRYERYGTATDLEDRVFGQGESNRGEYRQERDYQAGSDQDSLENRIRERTLQNSEREQRLARAVALMQAGDGLTLEQALAMVG
jgi:hypothetical protein